jgi:enoyl-CoA hydratase/carnithine racemase
VNAIDLGSLRTIRYELDDHVATVTLARPERRNAWTGRMHAEYRAVMAEADRDPHVRVVIVTGDGPYFCVGADARALEGHAAAGHYSDGLPPPDELARPGYGVRREWDYAMAWHHGMRIPIICSMRGAAAGIGLVIACWSDLRFAAEGTKIAPAHGQLGFNAELGLTWLLPRIVGLTHAADLLLSSRIVLAEEAYRMGLLNAVLPDDQLDGHVREYAHRLAHNVGPSGIQATKRMLYDDLLHADPSLAVRRAEKTMNALMATEEYREGVRALREKRPPQF